MSSNADIKKEFKPTVSEDILTSTTLAEICMPHHDLMSLAVTQGSTRSSNALKLAASPYTS
jgi:hypothetical protein